MKNFGKQERQNDSTNQNDNKFFYQSKVRGDKKQNNSKNQNDSTFIHQNDSTFIHQNDSTFTQRLEHLPAEILSQPRFFEVNADKTPKATGWSNPDRQKSYSNLRGLLGFDTAGHGRADDYLFLDFDHVLNDNGEFVTEDAKQLFNRIHDKLKSYCELSASGHGIHIIARPTAGKFKKVASGKNGRIYFSEREDKDAPYLEIFYGTGGRYCLFTGDLYQCEPQTQITSGEAVDNLFQVLLDTIADRTKKKVSDPAPLFEFDDHTAPHCAKIYHAENDDKPTEQERALAMLRLIPCAAQTYEDWVSIGMILKNNGNYLSDWEQWSRADERYKAGECESKWQGFSNDGSLTIATLHDFASNLYGYSEKAFQKDWHSLHGNKIIRKPPTATELAARLSGLKLQPKSKQRDEEIISAIRDMCTWNYRKGEDGRAVKTTIKSTFANIDRIFNHDPNLSGLFGFDNFQGENVFLKKAVWHSGDKAGEKWSDSDDAQLRNYLRANYAELKEKQLIEDYVIYYAHKNSFDAVKKFYETLPRWDGTARAENLFVKFLGAADSDYTREVTMKWLIGAIARVYHPGCDFQWAPVLQGAQRIGKSKLVKMLGGKEGVNPQGYSWHVALKDSVDDAHAVDALQQGGIIEIEEFSAARRAEINALKSFISADEDTRRFAYDRRATTRKRHGVFIVTCNDKEFLRDQTGNARFWIVQCTQKKFNRVEGMTPEYIRQVWAEVYQKYQELFKDGFDESKLKPSLELELRAEEIAEAYVQDDGLTSEITAFLDKKIPPAIVWGLMTKDERRKFFVEGQITFSQATLNFRRRAQGGKAETVNRDINEIWKLCNSQRTDIQKTHVANEELFIFYGSDLRQHICAAEIFNECFGTGDKRKLMYRFNEILDTLEGWHLGARLRTDTAYRDQIKPYYRDEKQSASTLG